MRDEIIIKTIFKQKYQHNDNRSFVCLTLITTGIEMVNMNLRFISHIDKAENIRPNRYISY